jgi:alpha-glucosidase (family GH31 glycosyl hydrolase)
MVPQNINNQYPLVNGTKILLGVVWPDHHVAFPDFLDPTGQTNQWWSNEFAKFREVRKGSIVGTKIFQTVAIDGVWIDMNEVSNFNTGFYNSTSQKIYHIKSPRDQPLLCPISGSDAEFDAPPYLTYSVYTNGPQVSDREK